MDCPPTERAASRWLEEGAAGLGVVCGRVALRGLDHTRTQTARVRDPKVARLEQARQASATPGIRHRSVYQAGRLEGRCQGYGNRARGYCDNGRSGRRAVCRAGRPVVDPAEGAGLFGFVVGGLTAAFLIGGGSYVGYAFIRSAVRMKRIKGQDGRNVVRPTLIVFALSLINLLVMPFPLPLRIFMCIGMLVIVVAHLARELEPPRRDPR
jgi:hypothetical protein